MLSVDCKIQRPLHFLSEQEKDGGESIIIG